MASEMTDPEVRTMLMLAGLAWSPLGDQSGEVSWRWRGPRRGPAGQDRASRPDAGRRRIWRTATVPAGRWRPQYTPTRKARTVVLRELDVRLNEEKSQIVDLSRGESFGFLGFDFRRVRRRSTARRSSPCA